MSQEDHSRRPRSSRVLAYLGHPSAHPAGIVLGLLFISSFVWFRSLESVFLTGNASYIGMSAHNRREIRKHRIGIWGTSANFHMAAIALPFACLALGVHGLLLTALIPMFPLPVRPLVNGGLMVVTDLVFLLQVAQWLVWIAAGPELFELAAQHKRRPSELLLTAHAAIRRYLLWCLALACVGFAAVSLFTGHPFPMWSSPWMHEYIYGS